MKVALVYFDLQSYLYQGQPNLGVAAIFSYLKSKGHQVEIFHVLDKEKLSQLPQDILSAQPDLIGFSATTQAFYFVKQIATALRAQSDTPIICGGIHATYAPEQILECSAIDFACRGEGEEAIAELCDCLTEGGRPESIRNLWQRDAQGELVKNPVRPPIADLDTLPFLDFSCFAKETVDGRVMIAAGRGCPYRCPYCCSSCIKDLYKGLGRFYRQRSVDNVIQELEEIKARYPETKVIEFWDDTFGVQMSWLEEFVEKYPTRIGLPFSCCLRPMPNQERKISLLKEAGCEQVECGIESGAEEYRRSTLKRKMTNADIVENFQLCNQAGFVTVSLNIFGMPGETFRMMLETAELNMLANPSYCQLSFFAPYPGTEFHRLVTEEGWKFKTNYEESGTIFEPSLEYPPALSLRMNFLVDKWEKFIRFFQVLHALPGGKALAGPVKALLGSRFFPFGLTTRILRWPLTRKLGGAAARLLGKVGRQDHQEHQPQSYTGE